MKFIPTNERKIDALVYLIFTSSTISVNTKLIIEISRIRLSLKISIMNDFYSSNGLLYIM